MKYDCIIIGGGIAGLQAAIQLGRYRHKVVVIDDEGGRSSLCQEYHNILGYPDGVSGDFLRKTGKAQAEKLGVEFQLDQVTKIIKQDKEFKVETTHNKSYITKRLLLATGIKEVIPDLKGIKPCLGKTIYLCPDCDGFEVFNKKTIVIGTGMKGFLMTKALLYWTKDLLYVNHDQEIISEKHLAFLKENHIPYYNEQVKELQIVNETVFSGLTLQNGELLKADRAFIAMGGSRPVTELAKQIHVERLENGHIVVNPRTKETNITHVYAAGDNIVHSQLLTVAMGDGAQAAIWIHKSLLKTT